jgi:hypothetical protein
MANASRQMIAMKAIGIRLSGKAELAGITSGLLDVEARRGEGLGHVRASPEFGLTARVPVADRSQPA